MISSTSLACEQALPGRQWGHLARRLALQCIVQCKFTYFIRNGIIRHFSDKTWFVRCTSEIVRVFTDNTTRGVKGSHLSEVTRTGVRVIGVNVSEILIKGKEIQFELAGSSSYLSSSFRSSTLIKSVFSIRTVVINIIIYHLGYGWRTLSLRMPKLQENFTTVIVCHRYERLTVFAKRFRHYFALSKWRRWKLFEKAVYK